VKQLVDHYGASIELKSELGSGTAFTVRFPRAPAREAPRSDPRAADSVPRPGVTRGRILLAEDDPLVRKALRRTLEAGGYEVTAVEDGAEAVTALGTDAAFVCIVSDVVMPNLDGEALALHVEGAFPALPMVLMSGNRRPERALVPGLPRTFLMKPIGGEELREAVARVISGGDEPGTIPPVPV